MGVHDADYNVIREALGIEDDEPIFILRAKDALIRPFFRSMESSGLKLQRMQESGMKPHLFISSSMSRLAGRMAEGDKQEISIV
jgi:hypothetical protein